MNKQLLSIHSNDLALTNVSQDRKMKKNYFSVVHIDFYLVSKDQFLHNYNFRYSCLRKLVKTALILHKCLISKASCPQHL